MLKKSNRGLMSAKLALSTNIVLLSILASCSIKNQQSKNINACDSKAAIIKTIHNEQGIFFIDETTGRASVTVHTPGSIDDVTVFRICNVPAQLPENNTKVTVSGKIRASKEVSQLGGYKYYELELENLKK